MSHLGALAKRFGRARVLAGKALISATLNHYGEIMYLGAMHTLLFGSSRRRSLSKREQRIARAMSVAHFDVRVGEPMSPGTLSCSLRRRALPGRSRA
ncbi:hypothetical protein [Ralstonia solanacearum]|uniref:hypothetical protein n=1 Tax=Ralstonia solanacearum TaxID=305 RepID=UPI0020B79E8C|nr:hypothetical protein [Ralstonia solanacearum]